MMLVVDMCEREHPLGFHEFVSPIVHIASRMGRTEVRHYSEIQSSDMSVYERILLSGTPLKERSVASHPEDFFWIASCPVPLLGICAGMQALALAFNSSLIECTEIGLTEIETVAENPLFSGGFRAYELHGFCVLPSDDFSILATSDRCAQAIVHKERKMFGVLFHPEVRNRDIVERFCSL
jgi:GMP synthase (glutamine-hydrolysing)